MKKIVTILILITSIYAANIQKPVAKYISSGAVTDIVYRDAKLYSATDASCVDIFDVETKKIIQKIKVSQIKDFMGDVIDSKVYSVDIIKDKILILSQAQKGARRLHIYENDKLELFIPYTEGLFYQKNTNSLLIACKSSPSINKNESFNGFKAIYRFDLSNKNFNTLKQKLKNLFKEQK